MYNGIGVLKMQLLDIITKHKQDRSDAWVAERINKYLPAQMQMTRQGVWLWQKKNSADPGIFYALLYHAPEASEEFQFAHDALMALGYLVEAEGKSVS